MSPLPRIVLATLALNEMEWLPRLWTQHRWWPGVVGWVFVEAADRAYMDANPGAVGADGLSVDGSGKWVLGLLDDPRVSVVRIPGGVGDGGPQGKCEARAAYLQKAERFSPDWVIVVDADEFYTRADQLAISRMLGAFTEEPRPAIMLNQRHIWHPPSIAERPLMALEAVGGYWAISHTRIWPYYPGLTYRGNHNTPELADGTSLHDRILKRRTEGYPECVHMGFASGVEGRRRKHAYYVHRGEGPQDGRQRYVDCRAAWETWQPGDPLPHGGKVIPYEGPVPEVFRS